MNKSFRSFAALTTDEIEQELRKELTAVGYTGLQVSDGDVPGTRKMWSTHVDWSDDDGERDSSFYGWIIKFSGPNSECEHGSAFVAAHYTTGPQGLSDCDMSAREVLAQIRKFSQDPRVPKMCWSRPYNQT